MSWRVDIVLYAIAGAAWLINALYENRGISVRVSGHGFDDGLDRAARELGVRFEPRKRGSLSAKGTAGDLSVSVGVVTLTDDDENPYTDLVVKVEGPRIPRGIRFAKEGGGGEDVLTGDPVFDDMVEVHGEPSIVLALMGRELRQKVALFAATRGDLRAGTLTWRANLNPPQAEIPAAIRKTLDLATALSSAEGGGICERLARNATTDPLPGVRLLNLLQLHDAFPAASEAREASRGSLDDASPWVRLAAARFLQEEIEVLESLARDRLVPDQAASEAVALLAARLETEKAGPILVDVLKGRTGDTQRQAIEELGRLRYAAAHGPLVVVMERADPRTAAAAATALGRLGDPRAEISRLRMLGREAVEVRLAAARALGRLGTVKSVAPLLALLQRGHDADGRQAIRGAIAAIQSRLVGAGAGQLTVAAAESESGRLSLADSEAGALTLADEGQTGSKRSRG